MNLTKDIKDKLESFAYSNDIHEIKRGIEDLRLFLNWVDMDYNLRKLQLSRQSENI